MPRLCSLLFMIRSYRVFTFNSGFWKIVIPVYQYIKKCFFFLSDSLTRSPRWRLKSPASRLFTQQFIQVADERKHRSSASLAFVMGIHRWPVNSPHKGPVTRKMFPFDDVIMTQGTLANVVLRLTNFSRSSNQARRRSASCFKYVTAVLDYGSRHK